MCQRCRDTSQATSNRTLPRSRRTERSGVAVGENLACIASRTRGLSGGAGGEGAGEGRLENGGLGRVDGFAALRVTVDVLLARHLREFEHDVVGEAAQEV